MLGAKFISGVDLITFKPNLSKYSFVLHNTYQLSFFPCQFSLNFKMKPDFTGEITVHQQQL